MKRKGQPGLTSPRAWLDPNKYRFKTEEDERREAEEEAEQEKADYINFSNIGLPIHDGLVPDHIKDYFDANGHKPKSVANFRWVGADDAIALFPVASAGMVFDDERYQVDKKTGACYRPKGAILLPDPYDETYAMARMDYDIRAPRKDGKAPPKYLSTPGRATVPYVDKSLKNSDLVDPDKPIYFAEGNFNAAAVVGHGVLCIGVNGHSGTKEPGIVLPKDPTPEQARSYIRDELHLYLKPGREVSLVVDADINSNLSVCKSFLDFCDAVRIGFGCKPVFIPMPDMGGGKSGINDFFAKGKTLRDFVKLPRHKHDSAVVVGLRNAFFDLTELGLSQRFGVQHGHIVSHDPHVGRGGRWFTMTSSGYVEGLVEPRRLMTETVKSLKLETAAAHGDERKRRAAFEKSMGDNSAITNALKLAADEKSIEIDSSLFDADQDLLGTQNGILRLSTGKLLAPSRELLVIKKISCEFDPKALAPLWEQAIKRIAGGDRQLIEYLQEIAGACLAGRSARQEIFFLFGDGANGKSLFIETLKRVLGDYAVSIPAKLLLKPERSGDPEKATPFIFTLQGRRAAMLTEFPENQPLDETMLKNLNGGDEIAARANYGDATSFRNTARIIARCNHLPIVHGTDSAVWDRIAIVPFLVTIPQGERDDGLGQKIFDEEAAGVFSWAYAGYQRWAKRKFIFDKPASVKAMTAQHRVNSDVLGAWIEDRVEVMDVKQPALRELQSEITASYTAWARDNNHAVMSAKTLWQRLRDRLGSDPTYRGDGGHMYARGFRLRRNAMANTIIDHQQEQIAELERRLAILKGAKPATSPTSFRKEVFSVVEGGKK